MREVAVPPRDGRRLRSNAGPDLGARYGELVRASASALDGHTLWQINATPEGGGVAELLRSCLGYLVGDGIDVRWLTIEGDGPFFEITKRIHNRLHGDLGDGGPLGQAERARYDEVLRRNLDELAPRIHAGDVAVVHDPQPLGLVPGLVEAGALVVWTCHVGIESPGDVERSAWAFLREDVVAAHAATFTLRSYVWEGLAEIVVRIIPPCIDDASQKNIPLDADQIVAILRSAGLAESHGRSAASFSRDDGSLGVILEPADVLEEAVIPSDTPLVTQVSRWDGLKDPVGVLRAFVEDPDLHEAHLLLAGPKPSSVADDPEAEAVLARVHDSWRVLPARDRRRVHVANLPTSDVEANAVIVNAVQRRSDVVVQKSLAEGFGLTVTEAMWKERPIVASGVGGIREQIDHGVHGLLVHPHDLTAFGNAVQDLLMDRERARRLGAAARARVTERYLPTQYLSAYLELLAELRD